MDWDGKLHVYVSGPVTKPDPVVNARHALRIADSFLKLGVIPVVPHLSIFWHFLNPHSYEHWIEYGIQIMLRCDVVFRIPGESIGADRETAEAKRREIPVVTSSCSELDSCVNYFKAWMDQR